MNNGSGDTRIEVPARVPEFPTPKPVSTKLQGGFEETGISAEDVRPGNAISSLESQSFVAWLINTQRFRRDTVGLLSAQFAVDERLRGEYRYATFHELHSYLGARMAEESALEALNQAYKEWCEAYSWYFGGQVDPKMSRVAALKEELPSD